MEIRRDRDKEVELMSRMRENWEDRAREGFALFEIINPRKAFFSRTDPQPLTDNEIMMFMSGKAIEKGLLKLLGYDHGESKLEEGIWYAPDIRFPEIAEVKSRRRFLPKEGDEEKDFDTYINQHLSYCALDGETKGYLVVVSLVERDGNTTRPELAVYNTSYTEKELSDKRLELILRRRLLEESLKSNDFKDLPYCPDWMCGRKTKHMVTKPWCVTCSREFSTDYHISKHMKSKRHFVKFGEYAYAYEKRCKWFDKCNPFGEEGEIDTVGRDNERLDDERIDGLGGIQGDQGLDEKALEGDEE